MWSLDHVQVPENEDQEDGKLETDDMSLNIQTVDTYLHPNKNKINSSNEESIAGKPTETSLSVLISSPSSNIELPTTIDQDFKNENELLSPVSSKENQQQSGDSSYSNGDESDNEPYSIIESPDENQSQKATSFNNSDIKRSESISSLNSEEDFVFIETVARDNKESLKKGYKWKRQLIFRTKLTMHTAFDRKDNPDPAAVSALAISKDNKSIYVGDSRGRVYSWICTETPGKVRADNWERDSHVDGCRHCRVKFSFSERKHHCRNCGGIFCNNCSRYRVEIPRLNIFKPSRVCQSCFSQIKIEEANLSPLKITN
jgi:WD repeat and FYVE domain-containing protein 3